MFTAFRHRVSSLVFGATLPFQALRLILSNARLLVWSAIPIVITVALSIWGVAWVKAKLVALGTAWLASHGYAPDSWALQLAVVFLQIVLFVVAAVSFSLLAGIVASPFNDFLAESTERYCRPALPLPPGAETIRWKIRAVWIDITKTAIIGAIQLVLILFGLLAFWIPGLNLVPLLAAFWLFTFQFVSYPQTRRGETFGVSFRFLIRHAFASLGFGAVIGTLFAIPVLSAFALPLAVVGGTLLYARANSPSAPFSLR